MLSRGLESHQLLVLGCNRTKDDPLSHGGCQAQLPGRRAVGTCPSLAQHLKKNPFCTSPSCTVEGCKTHLRAQTRLLSSPQQSLRPRLREHECLLKHPVQSTACDPDECVLTSLLSVFCVLRGNMGHGWMFGAVFPGKHIWKGHPVGAISWAVLLPPPHVVTQSSKRKYLI